MKKRVIIESPFAGEVEKNIAYARAAMKDCLSRGEAPYASHLLFPQEGILNDLIPEERTLGILAGFAWGKAAEVTAKSIPIMAFPRVWKRVSKMLKIIIDRLNIGP